MADKPKNYALMQGRSLFVSKDGTVDLVGGQTIAFNDIDNLPSDVRLAIETGVLVEQKKTQTKADAEAK